MSPFSEHLRTVTQQGALGATILVNYRLLRNRALDIGRRWVSISWCNMTCAGKGFGKWDSGTEPGLPLQQGE